MHSGIPVVLAEEDDGELPDGGEIQRLVERALGHRAVTEERDGDAAVRPQLRRRRRAGGDRHTGGDDAGRPEDSERGVGDVHGTATPAVGALLLAHQLREHPGRIEALGQTVPVATMRRGDDVGGASAANTPPRSAVASCPGREVDETGDLVVGGRGGADLFLEAADHQHPALHLHEVHPQRRTPDGG